MRNKMKTWFITTLWLLSLNLPVSAAANTETDTQTPKVLIIGDSISLGYTPYVVEQLKGIAVVVHHKGNAGPTIRGCENIDRWLGDTQWDLIHFNWGLWDMYGWRYQNDDRTPPEYEKRLESLVLRLKKTGAQLIWGTTTPVCPEAEKTMADKFNREVIITPATERLYLEAALRVMRKHDIQVNDLHALMKPQRDRYALGANDVHYTKDGYIVLARQVANQIATKLPGEQNVVEPTSNSAQRTGSVASQP